MRIEDDALIGDTQTAAPVGGAQGAVEVNDCRPAREPAPDVVRLVEGVAGSVMKQMDLVERFGTDGPADRCKLTEAVGPAELRKEPRCAP